MTNPNYTHIEFLLDRSGSMDTIKSDVEGGFNSYIADQVAQPGQCTVSLAQFDDEYEVVFTAFDVKDVPKLKLEPRGWTALLDAIGRSINALGMRLAQMPEDRRPGTVIFAIMTDGLENASKEYTHAAIKQMITRQERVYNWQFLYMGADQDAIEVGASIGIARGRSLTYGRGYAREAYAAASTLTGMMRAVSADGTAPGSVEFSEADRAASSGGTK